MIVIGVDSAQRRSGFAILASGPNGDALTGHGTVTVCSAGEVAAAAAELQAASPDLVVIEGVYYRPDAPGRGSNAATALGLAQLLGRWCQEFERGGIETSVVLASTWQTAVLPQINRWSRREERKAAARTWVRKTFGVELPEDESDAVGIAWWGMRNRQLVQEREARRRNSAPTERFPATRGRALP